MKYYAIQNGLPLGAMKLRLKKKEVAVKRVRSIRKDEQNSHVSDELLIWGMIYNPGWVATITAQKES